MIDKSIYRPGRKIRVLRDILPHVKKGEIKTLKDYTGTGMSVVEGCLVPGCCSRPESAWAVEQKESFELLPEEALLTQEEAAKAASLPSREDFAKFFDAWDL